jgi:CrcB protein
MRRLGVVFLGGGVGSCLRAALFSWLAPWGVTWPVLLANVLGAFVLGTVFVLADEAGLLRAETRLFLAVGVLGGFTTFSTFGWGADLLAQHDQLQALLYAGASLVGGLGAVAAGLVAGRALLSVLERGAEAPLRRLEAPGMRRVPEAQAARESGETEGREVSA